MSIISIKRLFLLLNFIFLLSVASYSASYEDISKEHWAYKAVTNLQKHNIIQDAKKDFKGNENISRYEFAILLSNLLDEVNLSKANKNDLRTLESLMFEFSNELNKIGFNTKNFNNDLTATNENIDILRERIRENERRINNLMNRLDKIESKK